MGAYYCPICDTYRDSHDGCNECQGCFRLVCPDCINDDILNDSGGEYCLDCRPVEDVEGLEQFLIDEQTTGDQ